VVWLLVQLLHQFSCEWHVLEELEAEQAKRAAAEMALHLTQAWMDKTLLRCEQLQQQHRLHRQQIKVSADAGWKRA
jgi:predicted metalloenzyme YecM